MKFIAAIAGLITSVLLVMAIMEPAYPDIALLTNGESCHFTDFRGDDQGQMEVNCYADLTDTEYVEALYRQFLKREPDAPGVQYWVGRLQTDMTRAQMAAHFLSL